MRTVATTGLAEKRIMPRDATTIDVTAWGLTDAGRGGRNLKSIRQAVTDDPFETIVALLGRYLRETPEPDRALNNLDRLLSVPAARDRLPDLLAADGRGLADVLEVLGTSQFFADVLIADPEAIEIIRTGPVRSPSTAELTHQLKSRVDAGRDDARVLRAFRRFRREQLLRVGVNDVIRDRPLEEITRDLSRIADACVAVAVMQATRSISRQFGTPTSPDGRPATLTALAFGKLGGDELNYSSDLDLLFLYDFDGQTTGRKSSLPNSECFARIVSETVRLLSVHTDAGFAYRVDLRLRPDGQRGALCQSFAATRSYYDVSGRTWERQALIKLRHVGGDRDLGLAFVDAIQPFIYRKYFSFAEINEVKALKRQMEHRSARAGLDDRDVKTGRGGIRDIEFAVQFLQLLNGGDLPSVRQRNTLLALESLELAGCLTQQETFILADAYRFLRKTEHRLQLLFDFQTHRLPDDPDELRLLARRLGMTASDFARDLRHKTSLDRTILDHLLHQTFADSTDRGEPESDLILDPNPEEATIAETLAPYRFRDGPRAYQNLLRLARESVPFLSARRCRHFLASIAPALLSAVAATPDPDAALERLERVTDSLGAKAVLYELFSTNPATLKLYVDLCATSPFLTSLLTNNPGMIDELLDSLVLDRPRSREELARELSDLLRGANDPDPILISFRDKELLRIGVRDLLGKDRIRDTTAALSDLAETILDAAFELAALEMANRLGEPFAATIGRTAVVGLGKLGGREISYHSDLDLLVLFDGPEALGPSITEWTQRAIRLLGRSGPQGKLYAVDMRLRPLGKSASLVLPLSEFIRYGLSESCQTWERQALTRGRVVKGDAHFATEVMTAIRQVIHAKPWSAGTATEIAAMRERLLVPGPNLKRSAGGIIDIEFVVQWLQLRHGLARPAIMQSNVWSALDAMTGLLPANEREMLTTGYTELRTIESRLRLVTDRGTVELPSSSEDLDRLARSLKLTHGAALVMTLNVTRDRIKRCYDAFAERERGQPNG